MGVEPAFLGPSSQAKTSIVACGVTAMPLVKTDARRVSLLVSNAGTGDLYVWIDNTAAIGNGWKIAANALPWDINRNYNGLLATRELFVIGSLVGSIAAVNEEYG